MNTDWFPDWRGATACIIGAGQSATYEQADRCRGWAGVIVLNRSWQLAPWADILYGGDYAFWNHYAAARDFARLKVSAAAYAHECWPEIRHVAASGEAMSFRRGTIGDGGSGGFQALNLAVQFGARRIVLIGFDCHGKHWHPDHAAPLGNPEPHNYRRWAAAFEAAAPILARRRIEVLNATPGSALDCFDRINLEDAL